MEEKEEEGPNLVQPYNRKDPKTGRFVKDPDKKPKGPPGYITHPIKPLPKLKPGEERIPHPTIPYRDNLGRLMPDRTAFVPALRADMNRALLQAITPDELAALGRELYELCMDKGIPTKERRELMELFLNRFLGKPVKEVQIQHDKRTTNVSVDLAKLTTEELQTFMQLQSKLEPAPLLLEAQPLVIDATPEEDAPGD